jgi:hypothetical protein
LSQEGCGESFRVSEREGGIDVQLAEIKLFGRQISTIPHKIGLL